MIKHPQTDIPKRLNGPVRAARPHMRAAPERLHPGLTARTESTGTATIAPRFLLSAFNALFRPFIESFAMMLVLPATAGERAPF